ncbi:hypothetical protein Tco_0763463 [Tanacetum coccineum]
MTMRTKKNIDTLSIDDLYNNLSVFEQDIQKTSSSSLTSDNVAFLSQAKASSSKHKPSHSSGSYSSYPTSSSKATPTATPGLADEVIHSFLATNAEIVDFLRGSNLRYALTANPTIYDSLVKQFWQSGYKVKKFYKKTGSRPRVDRKNGMGNLIREKSELQAMQIEKKLDDLDEGHINWNSYNALQAKYDELQSEFGDQEAALIAHKLAVKKLESHLWIWHTNPNAEVLGYKEEMSRGIFVLRETDAGYYDIPLYSRFKQVEYKGVPHPLSGDYTPREQEDIDDSLYEYGKLALKSQKGGYQANVSASHTQPGLNITGFNKANHSPPRPLCKLIQALKLSSGASIFNTVKQYVNSVVQRKVFHKTKSPVNRPFSRNTAHKSNKYAVKGKMGTAVKTSAGCVWRKVIPLFNTNSGPTPESNVIDHPLKQMEHRGIFDSGCSGHMTGNRAHLEDNQELSKDPYEAARTNAKLTHTLPSTILGKAVQYCLHSLQQAPLGKFDRKSDEGFLVGYSVNSKALGSDRVPLILKGILEAADLMVKELDALKSSCLKHLGPEVLAWQYPSESPSDDHEEIASYDRDELITDFTIFTKMSSTSQVWVLVDLPMAAKVKELNGYTGSKKDERGVVLSETKQGLVLKCTIDDEVISHNLTGFVDPDHILQRYYKVSQSFVMDCTKPLELDLDSVPSELNCYRPDIMYAVCFPHVFQVPRSLRRQIREFTTIDDATENYNVAYADQVRGSEQIQFGCSPSTERIQKKKKLTEQQRKEKLQYSLGSYYTNEDWDLIRAKLEAMPELFPQSNSWRSELQGEDFAKKNGGSSSLKRFGEELQTKTPKRLKEEKDDEAKDDESTKKSGKRRKQMARKGYGMNRMGWNGPEDNREGIFKCLRIMFEEPLAQIQYGVRRGDEVVAVRWSVVAAAAAAVGGGVEMRDEGGVVGSEMVGRGDGGSGWSMLAILSLVLHTLESCDPVGTPMKIKDKLDRDQHRSLVDATKYRSMIGALMYLTSSRLDIVHATCLCARYQAKPTEKHLKEVKRIFRYLRGTVNTGLWYTKDSGFELTGFSDADYAGCKDTFKSTSGGAQFLGEKLVSWSSKKQDCTAMSNAEAEYVSLSACCAQVLWMRTQLTDYGFQFNKILIYCDSK